MSGHRSRRRRLAAVLGTAFGLFLASGAPGPAGAEDDTAAARFAAAETIRRGGYLFRAAGCETCHTDHVQGGPRLAGGRAIPSGYGTLHAPNISPDPTFGIGAWSDADFVRAMRHGVRPDGVPLFPVCPYPAYTHMTDRDLLDIKAYVFAQAPVSVPARAHQLNPVGGWRGPVAIWQALFLAPGPMPGDPERSAVWHRGRYIAHAVTACDSCHTPRGWLGEHDHRRSLAGNPSGPDGAPVPNLTPHPRAGLGFWSAGDLYYYLAFGVKPDGSTAQGSMAAVVDSMTAHLDSADRRALVTYLRSLDPVE